MIMRNLLLTSLIGRILLTQEQYILTVIEDEKVPLAEGIKMEFYGPTIAFMILTVILFMTAVYLLICNRYRKRIQKLDPDGTSYRGWRLKRLKETVLNVEMEKIEDMASFHTASETV
ncbi:MAG: hypothetical protein ACI4HQ_14865 [Acetatifactor sp.]